MRWHCQLESVHCSRAGSHDISVFNMNICRYEGNNSAEHVHWTSNQLNINAFWFSACNPTIAKQPTFFFALVRTPKLGFCLVITIITSVYYSGSHEYVFDFFSYFALLYSLLLSSPLLLLLFIRLSPNMYLFCVSSHLNVNCMKTAMHWIIEKLFFYWLWNRSYVSFPWNFPPNPGPFYVSRIAYAHRHVMHCSVFFSFSLPAYSSPFRKWQSFLSCARFWPAASVNI